MSKAAPFTFLTGRWAEQSAGSSLLGASQGLTCSFPLLLTVTGFWGRLGGDSWEGSSAGIQALPSLKIDLEGKLHK
jgi:hypothetical protein